MAIWRNLKIGVRLGIGIGVLLVLLVVVAGAAFVSLSGASGSFANYRQLATEAGTAQTWNGHLAMARLNVLKFQLSATPETRKNVEASVALLMEEVAKQKGAFVDPDDVKTSDEIEAMLTDYRAGFESMVEFRATVDSVLAHMVEIGPKLTDSLNGVVRIAKTGTDPVLMSQAADALAGLQTMRLAVTKFRAESNPEQIDQTAKAGDALFKLMAEIQARTQDPQIQQSMQDATVVTKDYLVSFDALHKAVFGAKDVYDNRLAKIGPEVSKRLDAMTGDAVQRQSDLGPKASAAIRQGILVALAIAGLAIVAGIGIGLAVARSITKPIGAMTGAMGVLASGDKTVEIPAQGQKDEIGAMAHAVQVFKQNMIEADRLRTEQEEVKRKAEADRRQGMLDLADRFESSVGGVVNGVTSAATELQATAQSMSATAEQTSRQSAAVAAASEETTQNVQTVAAATEELSASIGEITSQVNESTRIVSEAVHQANDTNSKVKSLADAAQKIGDVVRLINDIAGQTNLLALNATIEAARAGEAGKGFAVVASEVKALATQTASATEEIASQVRSIQDATASSAQAIDQITKTIGRVSEISTAIASAVEEQGAATQEISRNVQQAAAGTQEVSSNISGVTEAARQTGTSAGQVLESSDELSKNGTILKTQVDEFLRTVRAG